MIRRTSRHSSVRRSRFNTEKLEQRALLCGLPHSQLMAAPEFDWEVEQAASAANRGGSGDAVTISWSNRGAASDGFASTFGTSANAARAVVDAVFAQWGRIISSFNRSDGTTTLQVNLSMTSSFGFAAAGGPAGTAPADGKPRTGSITINQGSNDGNPNSANGWFLDPTPMDNSEFLGTINHAYNARATNPSQGVDFFSIVNLELAHVLGIISDRDNAGGSYNGYTMTNFTTATGIRDNSEGGGSFGFFYVFDGPNIDHLMTSYNSGDATSASWGNAIHTSGPGNINFNSRNWVGVDDDSNAFFNGSERVLPSFVVSRILGDAYGYSIIDPATFATTHTVLNQSTGVLTVRGGQSATSSDVIVLDVDGGDLVVTVDVGDDVAGSGALAGAGNLPAYVTRVPLSSITSIVVNGGGARDYLRVERIGGKPVTINGGDGDDFIDFSFYSRNLDTTGSGSIYITGGNGADYTYVYDDNNSAADTYTITSARFDRPFWAGFSYAGDIEGLNLITGTAANIVNVESTFAGQPVVLNSTGGADIVNVGTATAGVQNIRADLQINNTPSFTTININNGPDTGDRNWLVNDVTTTYGSIYGLAPAGIVWKNSDMDVINLTTGSGVDTGSIARLSETLNINNAASNPGGLYDQITVGNFSAGGLSSITQGRQGGLTIDNNPSYTRVILDDTGNGTVRNATLQVVTSYNQITGLAPATIRFDDTDTREATIVSGSGADTINVLSYGAIGNGLTLNSWSGGDIVNLGNATTGLQSITTPIIARNTPSFSTLNLINNADTVARTITVDYNTGTDLESMSGISPAPIYWDPGDISSTLGVVVTTGSARDTINVLANERLLSLATAGAAGEVVNVGPDLDRINADLYTRNAPNFTAVTVDDTAFAAGRAITLDTAIVGSEFFSRVSGFGAGLYFKAVDTSSPIVLNTGIGNDSISVAATANTFAINSGDGDDHLYVGSEVALNMDPVNANVGIDGGAGSDYVHFYDHNYAVAGGNMNVNASTVTTDHSAPVAYANVELLDFYLSNAGSTLNVLDATTLVYAVGGNAHDVFNIYNNPVYTLLFASSGLDDVNADAFDSGAGGVVYLYGQTHDLGTLFMGDGAYVQSLGATDGTIRVTNLSAAGGTLDIADGSLIVNYAGATPMNSIRNALLSGRNGGTWNGPGITSSSITAGYALGYAESTQIRNAFPATFGAFTDVDNTSILIRYTLLGDANLDKAVNFDDLLRLAQSYDASASGRIWTQGDFDYNGIVGFDDLLALAQRYGNAFAQDWSRATQPPVRSAAERRRAVADLAI